MENSGISPDAIMEVNGDTGGSFLRQVWRWVCGILYAFCNPLYLDEIKNNEEELKSVKDDRDTFQEELIGAREEIDGLRQVAREFGKDLHEAYVEMGEDCAVPEITDPRYATIPDPPGYRSGFYGSKIHVKPEPTVQQKMDKARKSVMKTADRAREVFGEPDSDGSSA